MLRFNYTLHFWRLFNFVKSRNLGKLNKATNKRKLKGNFDF